METWTRIKDAEANLLSLRDAGHSNEDIDLILRLATLSISCLGAAIFDKAKSYAQAEEEGLIGTPSYTCPSCAETSKSSIANPQYCGKCGAKLSQMTSRG